MKTWMRLLANHCVLIVSVSAFQAGDDTKERPSDGVSILPPVSAKAREEMANRAMDCFPEVAFLLFSAVECGAELIPPKLLYRVEGPLVYGDGLIGACRIWLAVLVQSTGNVGGVEMLSGAASLPQGSAENVLGSVQLWKFRPATLDGRPTAFVFSVPVVLSLRDGRKSP